MAWGPVTLAGHTLGTRSPAGAGGFISGFLPRSPLLKTQALPNPRGSGEQLGWGEGRAGSHGAPMPLATSGTDISLQQTPVGHSCV